MTSQILIVVILVVLMIYYSQGENFISHAVMQLVPTPKIDPTLFTGFWAYETPDHNFKELIAIEYNGEYNFLNIRVRRQSAAANGNDIPPQFNREQDVITEFPLFRYIPITQTRIKLVSTVHTYVFTPTYVEFIETIRGPALIINGKYYYATGLTF